MEKSKTNTSTEVYSPLHGRVIEKKKKESLVKGLPLQCRLSTPVDRKGIGEGKGSGGRRMRKVQGKVCLIGNCFFFSFSISAI